MKVQNEKWLPLDVAAERFGYAHKESLSRRLRQLREQGFVLDIGRPPDAYLRTVPPENAPITIMWPNPKTALLFHKVSPNLLKAKRGRPTKSRK